MPSRSTQVVSYIILKYTLNLYMFLGFPGGSYGKESACIVGDLGSIPDSGRSPGEGSGCPLQYSYLENPWTEEPGRLQSMGSQRVRHDWMVFTFTFIPVSIMYWSGSRKDEHYTIVMSPTLIHNPMDHSGHLPADLHSTTTLSFILCFIRF